MRRFAAALAPLLSKVPPRLGTGEFKDYAALARLGWQIRKLGRRDMRELLRIGGMNVYDLLEERFSDELLKGALGFDAVLGTNFGPRSPGTVLTLLYRLAAEAAAVAGGLSQPLGGVGALCGALAQSARAAGAEIRTSSPVKRILVEADRAAGVELESGERIARAYRGLERRSQDHLPRAPGDGSPGYWLRAPGQAPALARTRREAALRARRRAAFLRGPRGVAARARSLLAPSLDYLERAYNHSKYGEYSSAPAMEITVPTLNDPGLAPPGKHVVSAIVQYAPYALKDTLARGARPIPRSVHRAPRSARARLRRLRACMPSC